MSNEVNPTQTTNEIGGKVVAITGQGKQPICIPPDLITEGTNTNSPSDVNYDEMMSLMKDMNFIEMSKLQKDIEKELENLVGAMNLIESVENMGDTIDDMNKKIAVENILHDKEFKEDVTKFREYYPENLKRLTDLKNAIAEKLSVYDDVVKGTSFLTTQMLDTLNKSAKKFDSLQEKKFHALKVLNNTIAAYSDRTSLNYLLHKASMKHVVDSLRKDIKNQREKCSKTSRKQFMQIFSVQEISVFDKYITEVFNYDAVAIDVFLYHLAKIIRAEKDTGLFNHVKVLVMNIIDITMDLYDLEGGRELIDANLKKLYEFYK